MAHMNIMWEALWDMVMAGIHPPFPPSPPSFIIQLLTMVMKHDHIGQTIYWSPWQTQPIIPTLTDNISTIILNASGFFTVHNILSLTDVVLILPRGSYLSCHL